MTESNRDAPPADQDPKPENTQQPSPGGASFWGALWKFLSSVHLAVILLLLLAGISIIGTVLAQGDSRADNVQLFENMLVRLFDIAGVVDAKDPSSLEAQRPRLQAAAERLYRFSERAGFMDLYHTWYFNFLLLFFSLNLTICTVRRWPLTWKMIARNAVRLEEKRYRTMSNRRAVALDLPLAEAGERVLAAMKKAGFSRKVEREEQSAFVFGQKGVYSRLGVYSTHLSILIILVGGIIGVTGGFKGYMQVVEGTSEDKVMLRGNGGLVRLPFLVRCDDFNVEYYPDSRRPKDYYSQLAIVEKDGEKLNKRIEVNSPLVWQGIYFYQSSYGETGQGLKVSLRIKDRESGEERVAKFDTRPQQFEPLGVTVTVLQLLPDFDLDENQRPYTKSNQGNNPAVLVEVQPAEGEAQRTWLFQRYPDMQMSRDFPVDISFEDYGGLQYTGLQVVYDPGVWVIWLGCTIMVLGLYLAFFISHRRVWVWIAEQEGGVEVRMAGSANKNRETFGEEFQRLGDLIASGHAESGKE